LIIAKILTDILSNEEQRLFPPHQNIAPAYFIMLPPHQNSKPSLFFTSHHPSLLSLSPQSMTMFHQWQIHHSSLSPLHSNILSLLLHTLVLSQQGHRSAIVPTAKRAKPAVAGFDAVGQILDQLLLHQWFQRRPWRQRGSWTLPTSSSRRASPNRWKALPRLPCRSSVIRLRLLRTRSIEGINGIKKR